MNDSSSFGDRKENQHRDSSETDCGCCNPRERTRWWMQMVGPQGLREQGSSVAVWDPQVVISCLSPGPGTQQARRWRLATAGGVPVLGQVSADETEDKDISGGGREKITKSVWGKSPPVSHFSLPSSAHDVTAPSTAHGSSQPLSWLSQPCPGQQPPDLELMGERRKIITSSGKSAHYPPLLSSPLPQTLKPPVTGKEVLVRVATRASGWVWWDIG